jgi:hypothetical protein
LRDPIRRFSSVRTRIGRGLFHAAMSRGFFWIAVDDRVALGPVCRLKFTK